jgi:hypothetical protein
MDLTAERLRELLAYEPGTGLFTWRVDRCLNRIVKAGMVAGSTHTTYGYVYIGVDGRNYRAHRLAWLYVHGAWPEHEIDHINGLPADNRIVNLRDVTSSANKQNLRRAKSSNKSSGLLGVQKKRNRWYAHITVRGRQRHIGVFDTPELAHAAYLFAKRQSHEGNTL